MRRSMRTMVLVLAVIGVPSWAGAQRTVDPVTVTDVSGYRASVTWLAAGAGFDAASGLEWDERGDKPCVMYLHVGALAGTGYNVYRQGDRLNICGGSDSFMYPLSANSARRVQLSEAREVIRGIQVCSTNASNHRLKGVRIFSGAVYHHEAQTAFPARAGVNQGAPPEQSTQANCAVWHRAVYCPNDHVASGLVVHHTQDEIVGMALRCRRVVPYP
jgi:hypothetical protein